LSTPWLSIVIPAYNEATRIRSTLDKLLNYFRSRDRPFEILVVDDGSSDQTVSVAEKGADPEVRVLSLPSNQGKGAAVRTGVAESRGELVLITDADLAIPIEEIPQFEQWLEQGFAVACGSRGLPESRALSRLPIYRKRMGKLFNWMVRCLQLTDSRDTQCGFKLFRGSVARDVFSRCRVNRFAYDVEALRIAERLGCRIAEVPISWRHIPESRVRPVSDAVRMLVDLLLIRARAWSDKDLPLPQEDESASDTVSPGRRS
jgi:dolichyl-phosphate beta-glucosyltransferase